MNITFEIHQYLVHLGTESHVSLMFACFRGGFDIHIHTLLQHYGLTGVFVMLFAEAIGIPFPSETTLITAGVTLAQGTSHLALLIIVATLGNVIGSTIAYWIGRYLGRPIILRLGKYVGITDIRLSKVEARFNQSSTLFLVIGKFIAFVRIIVPYLAGINKINFARFSFLNSVSAFVWAGLFVTIGKTIEGVWHKYKLFFEHHILISIGILIVIVLVICLIKVIERRNHK